MQVELSGTGAKRRRLWRQRYLANSKTLTASFRYWAAFFSLRIKMPRQAVASSASLFGKVET